MNIEKYTDRVKGFIQSAQTLAMREGHQQFTPCISLKFFSTTAKVWPAV
jgi:ATP-dependent Clp protease ATP-binding subunit ClpB